jgi:hypothetical protein
LTLLAQFGVAADDPGKPLITPLGIRRRVRLPVTATLGGLHNVIRVLFGWDGDHLHVFRAGKKQYSDPLMDLDGTAEEGRGRGCGGVRNWQAGCPVSSEKGLNRARPLVPCQQ